MNPIEKGMIEKLLNQFPEEHRKLMESEADFMLKIMTETNSPDELIGRLLAELAMARHRADEAEKFIQSMGAIYNKNKLFLNSIIGEATDLTDNHKFELISNEPMREMAARCKATGKAFVMSWSAVINLAIHFGVAEADKTEI